MAALTRRDDRNLPSLFRTDMLTTRLGKRSLRGLYPGQGSGDVVTMVTTSADRRPAPGLCPSSRPVSSSISVPSRSVPSRQDATSGFRLSSQSASSCSQSRPQEVDMDELMAAMVLSSLSCSPLLHGPARARAGRTPPRLAAALWLGGLGSRCCCFSFAARLRLRGAVGRQQRPLGRVPWQRKPRPLPANRRGPFQCGPAPRGRPGRGFGSGSFGRAGGQKAPGERELWLLD